VRDAVVYPGNLAGIDVEARDLETRMGELDGERQADIAETDYCEAGFPGFDFLDQVTQGAGSFRISNPLAGPRRQGTQAECGQEFENCDR
jgi:hypothetical protein